jgi:chorismate synthase
LEEVFVSANRFGHLFSVTTFGESHGAGLGAVIDGCPAGIVIDEARLHAWMERRRPGQSDVTSARKEADAVEILSGVFEGKTLGTPIAMLTRNVDVRSEDYSRESVAARPGHATDLWQEKFGHSDYRGSGRASGRETVARVMAGAVAEMFVRSVFPEARVAGFVSQLGPWDVQGNRLEIKTKLLESDWVADRFAARIPDEEISAAARDGLKNAKNEGESFGGSCELYLQGLPLGLGQPVFHKLKNDLASAMLSVGATAGVDFGEGFDNVGRTGGEFHAPGQSYGGLRGGISTGDLVHMRVAFKPASTLGAMATAGRHDPSIVPRALPVLEAMTWLVLADHILWRRLDQ